MIVRSIAESIVRTGDDGHVGLRPIGPPDHTLWKSISLREPVSHNRRNGKVAGGMGVVGESEGVASFVGNGRRNCICPRNGAVVAHECVDDVGVAWVGI